MSARATVTAKLTTVVSRVRWLVAPASVLVVAGGLLFPSAGHDDTHITCWPAYTLSHFGQILNYNGDRVEQSSSLLQVLLLATLAKLTSLDLLTLAKLSSVAFGIASLIVLSALVARVAGRAAGFCAAMIAAASTPIMYWSFGGLESTLVSFTGLCLILTAADYMSGHPSGSLWKPTLALSAFATVRPETPLLIGCVLGSALMVVLFAHTRHDPGAAGGKAVQRRMLRLLSVFVIVCGALFAFRLTYFGSLFPQPVAAKFSGLSVRSAVNGLHYVKRHAWNEGAATAAVTISIVVSVLLAALRQIRTSTLNLYVVLSLLFAVGYLWFVVLTGGDWMEGGRFLVHFLPVAIGFVPLALEGVNGKRWALALVTAVLVVLEASSAIAFAKNSSTSVPLWATMSSGASDVGREHSWFERRSRINVRDMPLIDHLDDVVARLSSRKEGPVVVMSGQMGMVSYYIALRHFGRVRFVDRHGLVERALTDCAITRDMPRDTGGLDVTFDRYFESQARVDQHCQLARPDIVFDIGSFSKSHVERYGYQDVYTQTGDLAVVGTRLTGLTVLSDAFVAVDARLLGSSAPLRPTRVHFGQ